MGIMEALEQFRKSYGGLTTSQVRTLIKEDAGFRNTLASLYRQCFHKHLNTGCSNCWLDAFVMLRRLTKQTFEDMKNRLFELKAGALLVDVINGDNAKMATHHNLTDELALYHLRTNPKSIRLFSKYPENWQELAEAEAEPQPKATNEDAPAPAEEAEVEVAELAEAEAEPQPKATNEDAPAPAEEAEVEVAELAEAEAEPQPKAKAKRKKK